MGTKRTVCNHCQQNFRISYEDLIESTRGNGKVYCDGCIKEWVSFDEQDEDFGVLSTLGGVVIG